MSPQITLPTFSLKQGKLEWQVRSLWILLTQKLISLLLLIVGGLDYYEFHPIWKARVLKLNYGSTRSCFEFTILNDEDRECNEVFGFVAELKLGADGRRTNLTRTHSQVIINETCTWCGIIGLKPIHTFFIIISIQFIVFPTLYMLCRC